MKVCQSIGGGDAILTVHFTVEFVLQLVHCVSNKSISTSVTKVSW